MGIVITIMNQLGNQNNLESEAIRTDKSNQSCLCWRRMHQVRLLKEILQII
ncbi:hypothetical protein [Alkalibacterium sp. 20]|uniref:hypothetical protein n=1 Tax=Alkalibacterium sp. 20 TaxID=1798803 RepID=UPI000AF3CEB7|nr:hypothetical protein [Alkalibacterium sp. 20]